MKKKIKWDFSNMLLSIFVTAPLSILPGIEISKHMNLSWYGMVSMCLSIFYVFLGISIIVGMLQAIIRYFNEEE